MALEALPLHSVDLVGRLDEEFPPRCIGANQTPEEAHRYAGKRELVDFLLRLLADTEENALAEDLDHVQAGQA